MKATNVDLSDSDEIRLKKGQYVKTSITDKGVGIPRKIAHRIFDPYFTTKQKGSGLGLSTSYFIIKNHGGLIAVKSKEGVGSSFHFFLPASSSGCIQPDETEKLTITAGGRVLIMDDEEIVRNTLAELLTALAYEVIVARNGEEALIICKTAIESGQPFDIAVLDLTVPGGMGGREAAAKLLEIQPDLRLIASSGYTEDSVMSDYKAYGFFAILPKPYGLTTLNDVLSRASVGSSKNDSA